jgi:hypothetical protein
MQEYSGEYYIKSQHDVLLLNWMGFHERRSHARLLGYFGHLGG